MDATIGLTPFKDVTQEFLEKKYWGGYNTAYFKEVLDFLGYNYTYEEEPRAAIIAERAPGPLSFEDLKSLIRFNNKTIPDTCKAVIAP